MKEYAARRLLLFIPTLLAVSIMAFLLLRAMPGDVALAMLVGAGGEGPATPENLAIIRHKLGLDQPLYIQYLQWLGGFLRGDLGYSLFMDEPIADILLRKYPVTLELSVLSMVMAMAIAVPAGIVSALKQDTWLDYVVRVFAIGGLAIPPFWLGILIILFLVAMFGWLPSLSYVSFWKDPATNLTMFIWPAFSLAYRVLGLVARLTRSMMLEVLREDYIRTAWSKGLRERTVIYRHALKNAMLPVVTTAGWQFGILLGGAVVTEVVFSLPGMGRALVDSIFHRDYPMVQAAIMLLAGTFLVINLAVDLSYAWLDPRIRYR